MRLTSLGKCGTSFNVVRVAGRLSKGRKPNGCNSRSLSKVSTGSGMTKTRSH